MTKGCPPQKNSAISLGFISPGTLELVDQWLFLVPIKGGIGGIVHPPIGSIYHVYTTYILPSRGLYNPYHLLPETEKSIEKMLIGKYPLVIGFLRVPGVSKGGGVPGVTLRIPFGKIGEP